ncbi:MAG TPA: hypothetical protein DCL21_00560 [Alphaproteobacteria bacterium]|nr:hypothetical protein [Alphaproteobacteria bacterium]
MLSKKGAMFGLDARIALTIFGALSVISGAALYSAIKQARVVALANEFKEVVKAYEAYVLDTGKDINSGLYTADNPTLPLIQDDSVTGWNGPYISYPQSADYASGIDHAQYDYFYISKANKEDWDVSGNPNLANLCDGSKKCYAWIALRMGTTSSAITSMAESLDEYFDGSDGKNKGLFRYDATSSAYTYARLYAMPTLSY